MKNNPKFKVKEILMKSNYNFKITGFLNNEI